jgi:hypothetical protein
MLLIMAATTQMLLFSELLLRRLLYVVMQVLRGAVQRYADNSVLSSFAAAVLQAVTVPLQAVASLLASGTSGPPSRYGTVVLTYCPRSCGD